MAKRPRVIRTSQEQDPLLISSESPQGSTPEHSEGNINTPLSDQNAANTTVAIERLETRFAKPALSAAERERLSEILSSPDRPSYRDIAEQLGTSVSVIHRTAVQMRGDDDLGARRQRSLQRQLGKVLTVQQRAMVVAQVALGTASPKAAFSQIAAVKLANELDNVVTAKEQRESTDNAIPILPPMFVLKDADVDIGVAIKVRKR